MNSGLNNWNSLTKRVLLLFVTASYSGGHYICVLNTAHFSRASKKHQFSTKTTKTKTNSTFKSWKCCFYADFARGLYFNTRLNWKRAFRSKTACRGFKSFCPCQKETVTKMVTVSFLLDKTCPRHARAGLRRRALPVADAARWGWRSGQNMA